MKTKHAVSLLCVIVALFAAPGLRSADWPIFKGNIYFTGNNDEIPVKNNNLKWLYQAQDRVFNPIVSDGRVYCTDLQQNVYCLDEENGRLIWNLNLRRVSEQFSLNTKAAGKVKYPLIRGDMLILSDSIVIYCLNKKTGAVVWARSGMREEQTREELRRPGSWSGSATLPPTSEGWKPAGSSRAIVDSIYANPIVVDDRLFYGTRTVFMSRDIQSGSMQWKRDDVKSYSGFPSFYDQYIFTQSMDHTTQTYTLLCIEAASGKTLWEKRLNAPQIIYSPVVYKGKVYIPVNKELLCLDLRTGEVVWQTTCADLVTANPAFTEREILFTVGNRAIVAVDPATGGVLQNIDMGEKSAPQFVIIRDQVYVASNIQKTVGERELLFTSLKAMNFIEKREYWEFIPPFPGGAGQGSASKGILFLPAGNYVYAVGADYYPRVVDGGDGFYDPYDRRRKPAAEKTTPAPDQGRQSVPVAERKEQTPDDAAKKLKMRPLKLTVKNTEGRNVPSIVDVRKWHNGKEIYANRLKVDRPGQVIEVPDTDEVEITAIADDHAPKKEIISRDQQEKTVELDRLEKGKGIVVENILFEIDQAYLTKESLNVLDGMIESLRHNPRIKLEVRGHTDTTGTAEHNLKLSERRADAVVEYMIKNGISPERVSGKGLGASTPLAANDTAEGRRKNRRTEFFILDK